MGECAECSESLALLSGASAPVQPIFHFEQPPERIRLKAPTPAKEVLSGRFCLCSHPPGHFLIVGARGNEVSQQLCRQSSRLKKSAVHRAVEAIGAGPPEELCAAFVDQSCGPHRELVEFGVRTSWGNAIQVGCEGAKLFDIHAVSSNGGVRRLPGPDQVDHLSTT